MLTAIIKRLTCILLLFACTDLKAQQRPVVVNRGPKSIIAALDSTKSHLPIEKLYLQTDKPYYTLGDTLWFKSYLLNADYLTPSTRSGLLYIELDNVSNQMIKRIMVPVVSGISWGNIALDEEDIPEGSYTLRAYTNWMRNFGEDYIFKKNIYISALSNSTLVKASFKLDSIAGKNKVEGHLVFTGLDKNAIRLKDMQLKVMNGRHNLFKDKATTGMDGSMNINFDLADKTQLNNLSIIANQTGKGADTSVLTIPVTINRQEKMDVQFMPEGGNLVAGIPTKVGFKAIGEDGKGTNVSGKIINNKSQTIVNIKTLHKGMGSFELTPEANKSYTAVINLPNKTTKSYPLPKVNPTGTALRVIPKGDDSLQVTLSNTTVNNTAITNYYLIGQSRGVVCYAAAIKFTEQTPTIRKRIATNLFPTGIARFTLLNNINQPLNERIVYIDHHDNLNISITPNKASYTKRDSIALNIEVKDKDNNPVRGTFSLAVTDNDQVKPDTIGSNIINDLLFTSDLKGTVEEPGWYFDRDSPDSYRDREDNIPMAIGAIKQSGNKVIALDNLLLTQGWVGYGWGQIFSQPLIPPNYQAEKEFTIQGKLTNVMNKPLKKAGVSLLQKQPFLAMDTVTDNKGRFIFRGKKLFPPDSAYYMIEATKDNGENKTFNVGIDVDEFVPPVFTPAKYPALPWYVNTDTMLLNNANTKAAELKAQENYMGKGTLLKEVTIKDKKIIPDSHNLNGPGEADFIMDEKEVSAAKKMTLFELLEHKFKGFHKIQSFGHSRYFFDYHGNYIKDIVIDGVYVSKTHLPQELFMEGLTAEDIKGVELMINSRYAVTYYLNNFFAFDQDGHPVKIPPGYQPGMDYLEVTTYTGLEAFFRHTPGSYIYKPIGFSLPKEFYSPRYTVQTKGIASGTDLRSTIHWQPNIITDAEGKAAVSFFSADKPADYTVIMEGTDLNGNLGYKRQKIKAASKQINTK